MEAPYYSSDEEIVCGPLTLREIRKELQNPRKIKRRESDFAQCTFYTPSTSLDEGKGVETNTTATSAYFTPNESLQPEAVANKNDLFLDKLNKVIEGHENHEIETSYIMAADTSNPKNYTLANILNTNECTDFDLEKEQQTLVENSVWMSPGTDLIQRVQVGPTLIEEISDEEDSEDVIIISSSDESSNSLHADISYEVPIDLVKTEKDAEDSILDLSEVSEYEQENASSRQEEQMQYEEEHNESIVFSEEIERESVINQPEEEQMEEQISSAEDSYEQLEAIPEEADSLNVEKLETLTLEEDQGNISHLSTSTNDLLNPTPSCAGSEEVTSVNEIPTLEEDQGNISHLTESTNDLLNPTPSCTSSEEATSVNESLTFNDTLEEMEMALKQGLNYLMPGDEDIIPKTPAVLKNSTNWNKTTGIAQLASRKKILKTPNKYDYIVSPIGDYIKKKSPTHDFKMPLNTFKKKPQTPNPKSPQAPAKYYKGIVSPIGIYIKNSPRVCLKQNVPINNVPSIKLTPTENTKTNKENFQQFPEVMYKPGKKVVTPAKKEIILPPSIQKMVKVEVINKHEKKVRKEVNFSKLRDSEGCNLTNIDSSLLNQTTENMSFVKSTQAFIK